MVNALAINQSIIRPLMNAKLPRTSSETLVQSVIEINDSRVEPDLNLMLASFLYGDTVILTEGGRPPGRR